MSTSSREYHDAGAITQPLLTYNNHSQLVLWPTEQALVELWDDHATLKVIPIMTRLLLPDFAIESDTYLDRIGKYVAFCPGVAQC